MSPTNWIMVGIAVSGLFLCVWGTYSLCSVLDKIRPKPRIAINGDGIYWGKGVENVRKDD